MVGRTNITAGGSGGSSSSSATSYIRVVFPSGSTCTAKSGTTTLIAPDYSGKYTFVIPQTVAFPSTWTVSCTNGTDTIGDSVTVTARNQIQYVELKYVRVPSGYKEVEYLEVGECDWPSQPYYTAGTEKSPYIDTGMKITSQHEVDIVYMFTNDVYNCGTVAGNYYDYTFLGETTNDSSTNYESKILYRWCNGVGGGGSAMKTNTRINVKINDANRRIIENGSTLTTLVANDYYNNFESSEPIHLFGMNGYVEGGLENSSTSTNSPRHTDGSFVRIYSYAVKNRTSGTTLLELIPCVRDSDSLAGMYDLVGKKFIAPPTGLDPFIVGPYV